MCMPDWVTTSKKRGLGTAKLEFLRENLGVNSGSPHKLPFKMDLK